MNITITLRGAPGFRTGSVTIGNRTFELVTWHKQADGHIQSTTADGKQVTLWSERGPGGITIGAERWNLAGCVWRGAEMTGAATVPVTDAEMAGMFEGWP